MAETMVLEMQGGGGRRSVERERTLLEFLRERMDGSARVDERRRTLKERLGLNGFGCCGAHWGFGPISVLHDDDDDDGPQLPLLIPTPTPPAANSCHRQSPAAGMNLATALAAERQFRSAQESPIEGTETPLRMSLMRLLHEAEYSEELERESREKDTVCCVCMGRKKGAAFIPCGHTFCRVCSREIWLNRGSCPLCNRPILEILDIF